MDNKICEIMSSREKTYRFFARIYKMEVDVPLFTRLGEMTAFSGMLESVSELAVDYARIFLSAGLSQEMVAVPYESVYTSPKHIVMQEAWEQVRTVYWESGIMLDTGAVLPAHIMEDHIACELEYMAWLCRETAVCRDIRTYIEKQRCFLKNHLLNWVPKLYEDILKYAGTAFYKKVGEMTVAFLREDDKLLGQILLPPTA